MYRFIIQYFTKRTYSIIVLALLFIIFYVINTEPSFFGSYVFITITKAPTTHTTTQKSYSDKIKNMKYILLWTNANNTPFVYLGDGRSVFINKRCSWNNCFVTSDRNFLGDYTEFDVIAFNGPQLYYTRYLNDLPKRRYLHQKYVYATIEASANYPICTEFWNNFFNLTWTYRMDSDIYWPYFSIKDKMNKVIGPKKDMNWIPPIDMDPIHDHLKASLATKTKAAAWFASNCDTQSLREDFVKDLQEQLRAYNLALDTFGTCGSYKCPRNLMGRCEKMLQNHYYFYLAFENSLSEDYVTEKILHGLNHNTVPIVLGEANYSRFMPDGVYLNALELGPKKLARKMYDIIQNPKSYYDFFRWKNHYSYHYTHESPETDVYCRFCEYLNDHRLMKNKSVYNNFNTWWTPKKYCTDVINVNIQ